MNFLLFTNKLTITNTVVNAVFSDQSSLLLSLEANLKSLEVAKFEIKSEQTGQAR